MKIINTKFDQVAVFLIALLLSGCGGGGSTPGTDGGPGADIAASENISGNGAGSSSGGGNRNPAGDRFGVVQLYPTRSGGREWFLGDATVFNSEWWPEGQSSAITRVSNDVFSTSGQVRLNIRSPSGKAWWRDVEMTGYLRYTGAIQGGTNPHWEFFGRGERHTSLAGRFSAINNGIAAPAGTVTWPWYDYGLANPGLDVNPACRGTAYHGNVYVQGGNPDGRVWFEKEVSHIAGYSRPTASLNAGFTPSNKAWFGMKLILRNSADNNRVHMELWLDKNASGNFVLVNSYDDTQGSWTVSSTTLDKCNVAPYNYTPGMLLNWAAPWVTFRGDDMNMEFKWLSVREIGPL